MNPLNKHALRIKVLGPGCLRKVLWKVDNKQWTFLNWFIGIDIDRQNKLI